MRRAAAAWWRWCCTHTRTHQNTGTIAAGHVPRLSHPRRSSPPASNKTAPKPLHHTCLPTTFCAPASPRAPTSPPHNSHAHAPATPSCAGHFFARKRHPAIARLPFSMHPRHTAPRRNMTLPTLTKCRTAASVPRALPAPSTFPPAPPTPRPPCPLPHAFLTRADHHHRRRRRRRGEGA